MIDRSLRTSIGLCKPAKGPLTKDSNTCVGPAGLMRSGTTLNRCLWSSQIGVPNLNAIGSSNHHPPQHLPSRRAPLPVVPTKAVSPLSAMCATNSGDSTQATYFVRNHQLKPLVRTSLFENMPSGSQGLADCQTASTVTSRQTKFVRKPHMVSPFVLVSAP